MACRPSLVDSDGARNAMVRNSDGSAMEPPRYHPNVVVPVARYGPPPGPWAPQPPARTSGMAVASLVCGLLGLFTFAVAAVPALICGYSAQRDARRQGRPPESAATVGIVLGWVSVALVVVVFVLAVMWVGSAATRY